MSVVPEFNLMDILFDREAHGKADEIKVDDKPTFDSYWDNSGNIDFLDSILFNHSLNDLLPSGDEFLSTPLTGSVCSDSGVSSDQQMSPESYQEGNDDLDVLGIVKTENELTYPDVFSSESIETSNECEVVDIGPEDVEIKNEDIEVDVEAIMPESPVQLMTRPIVRVKPVSPVSREGSSKSLQQPLSPSSRTSHTRPILIPVKGRKNLKTIKIIKAVGQQARFSPTKTAATPIQYHHASPKSQKYDDVQSSDEDDDSEDDRESNSSKNVYPRLQLTEEEKRLMIKEGISLPTHYPLTKQEERDLKRIRRKIRNKISAQDSRKRKKEYVDGLEDRVKQCTAENATLLKKMKALQTENQTLTAQLRRLQAVIARNGAQPAQPATCLMVLVLSLALILAPNMRSTSRAVTQNDLSIPDPKSAPLSAGRARTILENQPSKTLENGFQDIPIDGNAEPAYEEEDPKQGILSELAEMLNFRLTPSQHDHDYTSHRHRKRARSSYIVPPVDDKWPPPKRPHAIETTTNSPDKTFSGRRLTTIRSFAAIEPRNRTGPTGGPPSPSNIVEIELTSSSDDGF